MKLLTIHRFQGLSSKRRVHTHFHVWVVFFFTVENGTKTLERKVERGRQRRSESFLVLSSCLFLPVLGHLLWSRQNLKEEL